MPLTTELPPLPDWALRAIARNQRRGVQDARDGLGRDAGPVTLIRARRRRTAPLAPAKAA